MRHIITKRDLWYYQQFLKMGYSRICKTKYYLIWDVDTIPIRPINIFEGDYPLFDTRIERITSYYKTLERIFPGIVNSNCSYVTEHMIIKTDFMKNLLDNIEIKYNIPGKYFWEKILMVIDNKDINFLGFSEFETYGFYVDNRYPNIYKHRKWYSKRDAKSFFGNSDNLNQDDIAWLSKYYHSLSFEKWTPFSEINLKIIKNKELQKLYQPKEFFDNLGKC